jgi:hypothetical protein
MPRYVKCPNCDYLFKIEEDLGGYSWSIEFKPGDVCPHCHKGILEKHEYTPPQERIKVDMS